MLSCELIPKVKEFIEGNVPRETMGIFAIDSNYEAVNSWMDRSRKIAFFCHELKSVFPEIFMKYRNIGCLLAGFNVGGIAWQLANYLGTLAVVVGMDMGFRVDRPGYCDGAWDDPYQPNPDDWEVDLIDGTPGLTWPQFVPFIDWLKIQANYDKIRICGLGFMEGIEHLKGDLKELIKEYS